MSALYRFLVVVNRVLENSAPVFRDSSLSFMHAWNIVDRWSENGKVSHERHLFVSDSSQIILCCPSTGDLTPKSASMSHFKPLLHKYQLSYGVIEIDRVAHLGTDIEIRNIVGFSWIAIVSGGFSLNTDSYNHKHFQTLLLPHWYPPSIRDSLFCGTFYRPTTTAIRWVNNS